MFFCREKVRKTAGGAWGAEGKYCARRGSDSCARRARAARGGALRQLCAEGESGTRRGSDSGVEYGKLCKILFEAAKCEAVTAARARTR